MNLIKEEQQYILQTYKRVPLVVSKAKGQYLWDDKGKKYLDFFSGISVCNVGHCNPRVAAAIKKQAETLIHVSNHYYVESPVLLAKELVKASFPGKVFLANSGAEANECAIKAARKWGGKHPGKKGSRYEIITFNESFHGRTLATLAATGQTKFHKGFEPMLPGFTFAAFNDLSSVKRLINEKTVAVMVEPIQGEGGVNVATQEFLEGLRALCDRQKLLLIFDEVQTGLGRTGRAFAFQTFGVKPDVMTLAKSLAGGLPLGACMVADRALDAFSYGDHGSTFGGNPVSCAAARAVLKELSPALLKNARVTGHYFMTRLEALKPKFPFIREVRGKGLMIGMELDCPGKDIVHFCQEKGLIINCTNDTVLRFLPPLIISRKDVDTAIKILEEALSWKTSGK
jgi:predicted acetylornithine/succinylornithine family transaminase